MLQMYFQFPPTFLFPRKKYKKFWKWNCFWDGISRDEDFNFFFYFLVGGLTSVVEWASLFFKYVLNFQKFGNPVNILFKRHVTSFKRALQDRLKQNIPFNKQIFVIILNVFRGLNGCEVKILKLVFHSYFSYIF